MSNKTHQDEYVYIIAHDNGSKRYIKFK